MAEARTILVVEDNKTVAMMLYYILVGEGFTVVLAHDGEEALKKFKAYQPDLILSDVMIPKRNGFRFARLVKEGSDVPVIFLTSLGTPEYKQKGIDAGASDYIIKPFDPVDLVARIRKLLGTSRARARRAAPHT